jgi:hypothetical protein
MSILDNWSRHATASEQMKLLGESDYHQKAGYNFMQNFPNTPEWLANALATGYQYGTEGLKSLYNPFDNYTFSDAMSRAAEEARLNKLGIKGEGFDINEYTDFINKFDTAYDDKPILNVQNQEPVTLGFSYSGGYPVRAAEQTNMILPQRKPDRTEYDDLTDDLKALSYAVNSSNNTEEEENKFLEFLKSMGRGTVNYMTGLPFVGTGLKFIGDQFEYKPAQRGVYGYSAADLDRMNARGGWYSEPARAARRWENRQSNILNRAAAGQPVGNVDKLLGTHGYTSDGSGGISFTGQPEGDRSAGAGYSRSDDSWSSSPFAQGGLASLWQR